MEWRYNDSVFKRKMAALKNEGPAARAKAMLEMARPIGLEVVKTAKKDTRRFVRGAAEAFNSAGAGPVPVLPLQRSQFADQVMRRALEQFFFWDRRVAYHEEHGQTTWKSYRRAKRRLETATRYLESYSETAAVIGLSRWQRRASRGRFSKIDADEVLTKIYDKVYGGTGRVIQSGAEVVLQLVNHEPHAIVVERRDKTMANAIRTASGKALKIAQATYVKQLATKAGMRYRIG